MVLTVHHLGKSQSERIVWLCEELDIDYKLVLHERNPENALGPDSLKAVHKVGTAPVIFDDPSPATGGLVSLAESGAIVEYIIDVYGGKPNQPRLKRTPADGADYPAYVEWLHFSNATLQTTLMRQATLNRVGVTGDDQPYVGVLNKKWDTVISFVEERLKETGAYLAGKELSAADIMTVFTLTTMRGFTPYDLGPYPAILEYLQRVGKRDAYKRAMEKGDKGLEPMLGPKVDKFVWGKR